MVDKVFMPRNGTVVVAFTDRKSFTFNSDSDALKLMEWLQAATTLPLEQFDAAKTAAEETTEWAIILNAA